MDDQNQSDELYPIAVLIDELKVRTEPHQNKEKGSALQEERAY